MKIIYFRRLKYNGGEDDPKLIINQLVSSKSAEASDVSLIFEKYNKLLNNFEIRTFGCEEMPDNQLLFVPRHFVAIYKFIIDGMPQINFIDELPYLLAIKESVLRFFDKKISFEGEDFLDSFKYIDRLIGEHSTERVKYMFSYMPMALILGEKLIPKDHPQVEYVRKMSELTKIMTEANLLSVISRNALMRIISSGKFAYPIIEDVEIPPEEMDEFLEEYTQAFVSGGNRLMISRNDYENIFCFGTNKHLFIYTPENVHNREKILIIKGNFTGSSYAKEISNAYEVAKDEWGGNTPVFYEG